MKKKHATSFPPKTPPCGAKSLSCCCSNNLLSKPPLWIEESRSDHCSFWPRVPLCWNSPVGRKEGEHRFFQGKHFEMWDVSNFGEEMDGMMIRMFIRDEARGNEALSGVLFNNIQKTTSFYDLLHITSTGFHMSALYRLWGSYVELPDMNWSSSGSSPRSQEA